MKLLPSGHSVKGWGDWANKNSSALRVCRYTTFFGQATLSYIVDFSELQPSLLICFQWLMCIFKKRKEKKKNANPLDFLLPCHLWWQCAEKIELTNNFLLVKKMQITDNFPLIFLVVILGKRQMSCNKMFVCIVSVLTIPLKRSSWSYCLAISLPQSLSKKSSWINLKHI